MTHRDFRKLDQNTQAELRRLALSHIHKGKKLLFVAELVEVHIQTVRGWIRKRKDLESRGYQGEKRGRNEGEKRLMTKDEELEIINTIENNTPDQVGLGSALWTRRVVHQLIKISTNNDLHLNTVGDYLQRWGYTAQRPGKIAFEQDRIKIDKWIQEEYPKIEALAKEQNAEIYFGDETGVSLNTYYGKTYAVKGKTPVIKLPARRTHISMLSVMSNLGLMKFMIYQGGLDSKLFIEFLGRLIKNSDKKVFLIVDNLRVHKSKEVLAYEYQNRDRISLFFPTSLCSTIQSSRIIKQYLKTRNTPQVLS